MAVYNNAAVDNIFASDAEWRTWCQAIDTAMKASGFLIAASDTGQIDLTTAVRPAINTLAGFKMYRASDALQATKPMFVKLEFGVGGAITRGKLTCTIATSTNGSGTMSGNVSSAFNLFAPSADGTAGFARVFAGGGESSMWFVHNEGAAVPTQNCLLFISRSHLRADGSASDDFMMYGYTSGLATSPFFSVQYCTFAAIWASFTMENSLPWLDGSPNTGGDVSVTYLFDALFYRGGRILTLPLVIGKTTELPYTDPDASAFTIDTWGDSRTFVPVPWTGVGTTNVGRVALPWEA